MRAHYQLWALVPIVRPTIHMSIPVPGHIKLILRKMPVVPRTMLQATYHRWQEEVYQLKIVYLMPRIRVIVVQSHLIQ